MHRLIPEFIIQNYRARRMNGSIESVGMFLDLSGFSAMTDALMRHGQHGAEVLAGLMRTVFDPLVAGIFEYGGQVTGFAGDGVSAIFPAEPGMESAARRGLAAAWLIQKRLASQPARQTEYGTFAFSVKIGLACGDVDWGILESAGGDRAVYYFRGSAVSDSSDAEHQARPGDIILTQGMFDAVRADVEAERAGAFYRVSGVRAELHPAVGVSVAAVDEQVSRLFVADGVLAEGLRGEFRQIVNVFIRFPDLGDEALQDFMRKVFELQYRYGGLLSRLDFGDKGSTLLMLWGAPSAYENDISRALNFALDLQAGAGFPVSIGITYYIAHAGYLGSSLCEDYTCYGWGVNLAARFMVSAPAGEIWMDERVARRVSSYFDLDYVGAQRFKGFAAEQKVYLLRARKTEAEPEYPGEMVGREAELLRLAEFVSPLWDGKFAGSIMVWGDAGIGKGRLVYEFRSSPVFDEHPALWAICQSDQITRQPFNPFRYWLAHYFGILSRMTDAEKKEAFDAKLDALIAASNEPSLADELRRLRSVLGALVDLRWADSFYEQLDAEGRYDNTLLALIALLKAESLRQPVILFWEDAQFMDDDSRNFLPRLKRALTAEQVDYPLALIGTSRRHGPAVPFADGLFEQSVELASLPVEAISRLAEILLGGVPGPDLVKLLMDRSEGNPYFAEQILFYLQEEKLIEISRAGWTPVKRLDESILPADISAVLVARLDQLAREVRAVIQTASVLGREFEVRVLARMLTENPFLLDEIEAAERAAIWAPLSQIRYLFTHGLLRDAAYSMQMQSRRHELHALALASLENLFAGEIQNHYGELAYHSEQAALAEKAFAYLRKAGDAARDAYQNSQALNYYVRALVFAPQDDLRAQFDLHRECELLLAEMGRSDERVRTFELLQSLAAQIGAEELPAYVAHRRACYEFKNGKYGQAASLAEDAVRLSKSAPNGRLTVDALGVLLQAFQRQGRYAEAVSTAQEALELSRSAGYVSGEADVLTLLGLLHIEMKDPVAAAGYYEKSLALYNSIGNIRGAAMPLNNLGNVAANRGNFELARDYYEQSLRLAREIGRRKGEALLLGNLGWLSGLLGQYQKARQYSERQLVIAREIGDRYSENLGLINLSGQVGALGDHPAAVSFAEAALVLARESGDRNLEAWALTYLGHSLFDSGMIQPSNAAYQSAVGIRVQLNQDVLEMEPRAGLARTDLALNNLPAAMQGVEKILAHLASGKTLDGTDEPARIHLNCYLVLDAAGDDRALPLIKSAFELLNARAASIAEPAARQSFFENIPWNREIVSAWERTNNG